MSGLLQALSGVLGQGPQRQIIPSTTEAVPGPWAGGLSRDVMTPAREVATPGSGLIGAAANLFGGGGGDGGVLGAQSTGGGAIDWTQIQGIDPALGAGLNRMQAGLLQREGGTAQQLGLISKVPVLRDILGTVLDVYGTAQAARRGALGTQRALGQLGTAAQVQAFPQFALGAQRLAQIPREERESTRRLELATQTTETNIDLAKQAAAADREVDEARKGLLRAQTDTERAQAYERYRAAEANQALTRERERYPGELPAGTKVTPDTVRTIGGRTIIETPRGPIVQPGVQGAGAGKTPPMGAMSREDADRKADEIARGGDKPLVRQLQGQPGLYTVDTIQRDALAPERQAKAIEEIRGAAPTIIMGRRVPGTGTNFTDALSRQQLQSGLERVFGSQVNPEEVLTDGFLDLDKLNRKVAEDRIERTMMGF